MALEFKPAVRKACPQLHPRTINVIGQRFGALIVTAMLPKAQILCDCDCGTKNFQTESWSVRHGLTRSCGCRRQRVMSSLRYRHGESNNMILTPEYRAWCNMITRCYNPKSTHYKYWGGRGITICPRWRESYENFLADLGRKPSRRHSIDRWPNPDGNYEPGNVRWATPSQQRQNQRRQKGNPCN